MKESLRKTEEDPGVALIDRPTTAQRLYVRYVSHTLIDLTILNLFDEYWKHVAVDSFTTSILAAILLQVLLKVTLALEHRVADYFNSKSGSLAKFLRWFCAWLILFGSKFVMLEAINLLFGDRVLFTGPLDGIVAFIVIVVVMVVAEGIAARIYWALGNEDIKKTGGKT